MANTYTYEDFEKALRDSGFSGQFSTADLALAKRNPDAGMSLLSYKQDWANATTDEMRALANAGAEEIRSSFGEYTGGTDGSGFHKTPLSPQQFEYGDAPSFTDKYGGDIEKLIKDQMNRDPYSYSGTAPTYTDNYAGRIEDLINEQLNRKPYEGIGSAPVYESKYGDTADGIMKDILNRGEFQYDHTIDPLYSAYAKQYAREGKRATADALGEAASATGGLPSSYAVTAASQAGNYHAAQMADKIPELYQIAYDKYLNEYNMKLSDLNAAQGLEQFNYGMYQDELSQFNRDRDFDYAKWLDEYEMGQQNIDTLRGLRGDEYSQYLAALEQYNTDRNFDYAKWLDEYEMGQQNIDTLRGLRSDEYEQYLAALGQHNTDKNFSYGQLLDEIDSQANERAEKREAELTQYEKEWNENEREYSREQDAYDRAWAEDERTYEREQDAYLKALDENERTYNREQDAMKNQLELAKLAAEAGDDSYLRALGINPTAEGEISNEMLTLMQDQYADGVVADDAVWNQLVSQYGEEALAAAGFTSGGAAGGKYDSDTIALNLYFGAAELGITTWDAFKSALIENGVSKSEADRLTKSYKEKYGENIFNNGALAAVQGAQKFMK